MTQLNADGTLDDNFPSSTFASDSPRDSNAQVQYLSNGEAVLATVESGDNQNIRLRAFNLDGKPNLNFGTQGQVSIDLGSSLDTLSAFLITPEDQLFLLGRTGNLNPVLVQRSKNGERVGSFGTDGQIVFSDDRDISFDDVIWNGVDVVLYDVYTAGKVTAAKVKTAGAVDRFIFDRPTIPGNNSTTLSKIIWSNRLGRYVGYGDVNTITGAIYTFAP